MGMMMNLRRSQMMPREKGQPNNEIWYTSTDGKIVEPTAKDAFGVAIKSNTYENGKGVITFDGDVKTIGSDAFLDCQSLASITIPEGVTTIGEFAFYDCVNLASITLSEGVMIEYAAFYYCVRLASITLPKGTEIGEAAFTGCSSLASITLPEGVTTIGPYAFEHCKSLTSITIPESVTTIGLLAFSSCTSLVSVYCKPTTPPTGGSDMFRNNSSDRKIYVPKASVSAYKAAQYWSGYASYIVGYDF